jgi:catalase
LHVFGDADRSDHRIGNYNYSPPGALFRLMSADQKQQRFGHFTITIRPMGRGVIEDQPAVLADNRTFRKT